MRETSFGTKVGLACGVIALLMVVLAGGCGDDQPDVKNRVPTVPYQLEQAKQAAKEAKDAADRAVQAQTNIQAAIGKLDDAGRNSDGSVRIGHPETSNPGTVTSVGEAKSHDGETTNFTFYFTFAERNGFVKTFTPVCPNQSIPVNNTVILNFHWQQYTDSSNVGCYKIDGYTVVK